ncbi:MAG TPA: flagellar filament capping protein FliD [Candidatus Dormibacteraeota bacterium]|nr:flagellar filament capping protein FliD [Candidatus Dormibacteraeota bacterium]
MSSSISALSSLTDALAGSGSSSSSTTSGTGLGQGINVQQFVQYAVADQQANITALQTQQTTLGSQTGELSTISRDLSNLDDAVFALSNPLGALNGEAASSSNSSVVSATASGSATPGSHSITVNSLATTSSYYTNALSSSNSTISPGSFQIQVGSNSPVTVTVNSSDNTLSQLAASINNQNIGVTASVIQDANGYRLALVSNSSGAPGDITVSSNTGTGLNFTKAVTGTNASLVVDGIPISSASNTVSNVINGVTLNLGSAAPNTSVAVNVSPDTSQATTAINNFVSAWNTVITEINNQFKVASDGSGGGALEADNTLQQAQSMLLSAISYSVSGNNGMVNLASIGVNMNDDGTLTVDNGALSSALASNFSAVQNLMQNATSGFAQNLDSVIQTINAPNTGILSLDSQSITNTSQGLTQQISDLQAALATQEANLTTVYSQVNATLQELPLLESQISQQIAGITGG